MQFKPKIHKPAQEVVIHRWIKNGHETLITSYSWGFKLFSLAFFANCLTSSPILERPFLSASCIYYEYKVKVRTCDWNKGRNCIWNIKKMPLLTLMTGTKSPLSVCTATLIFTLLYLHKNKIKNVTIKMIHKFDGNTTLKIVDLLANIIICPWTVTLRNFTESQSSSLK